MKQKTPKEQKLSIIIRSEFDEYDEKLEQLMKIYNVKTYSTLVKLLIDAEIRRQGL